MGAVRRVLKPNGESRFYEHWLGAGCHPNRDVSAAIEGAGFQMRELRRQYPVPNIPPLSLSRPHILGVALSN
jgi:hypothetical protein